MPEPIDPGLTCGAVALTVADLARSLDYYQHHIGLALLARDAAAATLGAGGRALLRLYELPGARHVRRATGLYHFALRVPTRRDLARVIQHFSDSRTPVGGASDHLVSEALYLTDPDGHGIEIYRDRPRSDWYDASGNFLMTTVPLDFAAIMRELDDAPPWDGMPPGTDMGHVHLQVADVPAADRFYVEVLGMDRMLADRSVSFVSAGGYHHHLGLNSWAGVGAPAPPADAARLLSYELVLPTDASLSATLDRVRAAGVPVEEHADGWAVRDPSHNTVVLRAA